MIDLILRKESPRLVCSLSDEAANAFAQRMLAAATEAAPSDGIVLVLAPAHGWKRALSVEEACEFGAELCEAIQKRRRAAGYSPIAEEVEVQRDKNGDVVGMSKRLRY